MKALQLRGHCQQCGAEQAVNGTMSKHGYTVKNGWFQGICYGHNFAPIENDRAEADATISRVNEEVAALEVDLQKMRDGKIVPKTIKTNRGEWVNGKFVSIVIAFSDATAYEQRNAVETMIYQTESRIRAGKSFAVSFLALVDKYHGQPLIEVKKPEAAPRIQAGEVRVDANGTVKTATIQDGARVYFNYTNSVGKTFKGWIGSRVWRQYKLVGKEVV
jgi:hypothetical protein